MFYFHRAECLWFLLPKEDWDSKVECLPVEMMEKLDK